MNSISYFDLETAVFQLKSAFPSLQIFSIVPALDGIEMRTTHGDFLYSPITEKLYKVVAEKP